MILSPTYTLIFHFFLSVKVHPQVPSPQLLGAGGVNCSQYIFGTDCYDILRAGPLRPFQFPILFFLFQGKHRVSYRTTEGRKAVLGPTNLYKQWRFH